MHREKSLFDAGDSLLGPEIFPVPAHREFASKSLDAYELFGAFREKLSVAVKFAVRRVTASTANRSCSKSRDKAVVNL
jgi:hypothetical protein